MKGIHLCSEYSRVESPFPTITAGKDFPFMKLEAFADAFCGLWKEVDVIVLDALFSPDGASADTFGGITFLKLIRMKGLRQHTIVYSPFPLSYLLRKGHNGILLSGGTSYEWLPERIDEAMCQDGIGRPAEEDLSAYFLPEYNALLRMGRHSLANWWGVLRLYHTMTALGLLPVGEVEDPGLGEALSREASYPGRLMHYVRFRGPAPQDCFSSEVAEGIHARLETIHRARPKVVYVDDQASDGWAYLLQFLLYGGECRERFIVPSLPPSGLDLEALSERIQSETPNLVILDMRLADQEHEPSGLTLIDLLSRPGNEIGCPILSFTASDKRSVSDMALSLGADAVWTKEGIDESEHLSSHEYATFSAERFESLVSVLESFFLSERQLLYEFLRSVNELDSFPGTFWWEREEWYPGDDTVHKPVPRQAVVGRLRNVFLSYKSALSPLTGRPDQRVYRKLTMELCWIMEALHSAPGGGTSPVNEATDAVWPEGTEAVRLARNLVRRRNATAHSRSFEPGRDGLADFQKTAGLMMKYLTMDTDSLQVVGREFLTGELVREETSPGGYCLRTGTGKYFFRRKDADTCARLYGDPVLRKSVSAILRPPVSSYDFFSLTLTERQSGHRELWTMRVRSVFASGYTVLLASSEVYPAKDVLFRVEGPLPERVEEGDVLRFNLFCSERWEGEGDFRVFQVGGNPRGGDGESTWSGKVGKVIKGKDGIRIGFVYLTPPKRWSFQIPRIQWDETDGLAEWAAFRPDWRQWSCVSRPVLPDVSLNDGK